jgi:SAM-dependent methyltransferase
VNELEKQSEKYWDQRYQAEGRIWGQSPSRTAHHALSIFQKNGVKTLLVPGSGYGRHTCFFSSQGFAVTGVEISGEAVKLAREFDPVTRLYQASALDLSFDQDKYDAVYCFNVLHLLLAADRARLVKECAGKVKARGFLFFTVFSEKETDFGKGKEVEKNTFETRPGRPAHYFTESELKDHFSVYNLLESGLMEDPEDHGGQPHVHQLRYICVRV